MKNTVKKSEQLVSEISRGKNAKAQKTLESIIRAKLDRRVREIREREQD